MTKNKIKINFGKIKPKNKPENFIETRKEFEKLVSEDNENNLQLLNISNDC